MKLTIINLLFLIFPFTNQQESEYKDFRHFVSSKYFIPKSVQSNCNWHYAIVKATIKDRKIIGYKILNETSDDIKKSFKFLTGYRFLNKNIPKNQILVFCLSIENLKTSCDIPRTINYTPTEVLSKVMSGYAHQREIEPNSVFLFNPIISIMEDPRY
jgi:hypothetical protein